MVHSTEIAPLQEISAFICVLNRGLIKEHEKCFIYCKKQ